MKNSEKIMNTQECADMVEKKTWKEFRDTGLFLFVNHFLHIFGWSIVVELDGDKVVSVYPARVKFRGFDVKSEEEAFIKLSAFMRDNAANLLDESSN